jgi:hypothetical protein
MVEQEGYGVRENLAHQPAGEVPHVACPHPLYGVTLGELREDGVYPVAKTAEQGTPSGSRISLLGGIGGHKLNAHRRQFFYGFGRVVVAVSYNDPRGKLGDLWKHGEFMGVGRSYRKASDDSRPAHPHMHPEAVEGLPEKHIFAKGSLSPEAMAAVSAGEQARWQGHRIADGEGGVVGSEREKLLPEALLYFPEVGCLPSEGSPVHLAESRKPFSVVTTEEEVDALVGVDTEELAYDLDSEDLGIGEFRGGTALADTTPFEPVVHETEDGNDEGAKIHRKRPPSLRLVWAPPSVGRSPLLFNLCSEKLAHGVS